MELPNPFKSAPHLGRATLRTSSIPKTFTGLDPRLSSRPNLNSAWFGNLRLTTPRARDHPQHHKRSSRGRARQGGVRPLQLACARTGRLVVAAIPLRYCPMSHYWAGRGGPARASRASVVSEERRLTLFFNASLALRPRSSLADGAAGGGAAAGAIGRSIRAREQRECGERSGKYLLALKPVRLSGKK